MSLISSGLSSKSNMSILIRMRSLFDDFGTGIVPISIRYLRIICTMLLLYLFAISLSFGSCSSTGSSGLAHRRDYGELCSHSNVSILTECDLIIPVWMYFYLKYNVLLIILHTHIHIHTYHQQYHTDTSSSNTYLISNGFNSGSLQ